MPISPLKVKIQKKPIGYIVYEGPSACDSEVPIVVIVNCISSKSHNIKTGSLAQSWIIRQDMKPNEAVRQGLDHAICGACPYAKGKGCYVGIKTVCSVYNAYRRGSYAPMAPADLGKILAQRVVDGKLSGMRAGSYGDPAMAPYAVWEALMNPVRAAGGKTAGYTHAWSEAYAHNGIVADPSFKRLLMASAHGSTDAMKANMDGWRAFTTFNTIEAAQAPPEHGSGETRMALCPASKEAGFRRKCSNCGGQTACNGSKGDSDRRVNVAIVVHGSSAVKHHARISNEKASID